jgi:hypothetical protein
MKRSSGKFHDYTETVIELTAQMIRHQLTLSGIGDGDSRSGIDAIKLAALAWVDADDTLCPMWDGEWIEAVQEYAYEWIVFAMNNDMETAIASAGNIAYDVMMRVLRREYPVAT